MPNPNSALWVSVFGYWNIPSAYPTNGIYRSPDKSQILQYSPLLAWTGLGGRNTSSLAQSGTSTQTGRYQSWFGFWNFYVYASVWIEWYPGPLNTLVGFTVNPGDSMQVHTWVGDSAGNLNAWGQYAWTYVIDNTLGTATESSVLAPSGYTSDCSTAEWILESNIQQADYGSFVMPSTAFAQAADYSIHQWFSDPSYSLLYMTAINNGSVTRTSTSVGGSGDSAGPYSLHFTWLAQ